MTDDSGIDKLTPKQQAFVEAYLACGNASQAYREVYSTANMAAATINREASALLSNPKITTRLAELRDEAAKQATLNRSWVLQRLMKNAEVALGERTITLRVPQKDKETGKTSVSEIEVSAHDATAANRALELLGRTDEVRAFVDRHEVSGKDGAPFMPEPNSRDMARAVLDILRTAQMAPPQPTGAAEPESSPTRSTRSRRRHPQLEPH